MLNGVVVSGDAISRSLILKREALLEAYGDSISVSIATYRSNVNLPGTYEVSGLVDLLSHRVFYEADLLIYEFGIYYDFFDSVRFTQPSSKRLGVWHNITPTALATSVMAADLLERSLDQRSNLLCCDHIFCDSDFNLRELEALKPPPSQVSVLKLPVGMAFSDVGAKPRGNKAEIRLLYVGRIVPAKGVLDLVQAFIAASTAVPNARPILDIIGNTTFSDHHYVNQIREKIADGTEQINLLGHVDEATLVEAYRSADIFVMPSYHEGYCVPVLEAFAAGCHVIAYDAGNLPNIVGVHGLVLRTGDVDALRDALIVEFRERAAASAEDREPIVATALGPIEERKRRDAARRYVADYSEGAFRESFISTLEWLYRSDFGAGTK